MRKLLGIVVAILAIVGAFAVLIALLVARGGMGARAQASRIEVGVVEALRDFAVPRAAKAERSPIAGTPEVLTRGRRHFAEECALCHGNDGRGKTGMGGAMFPPPPDLRTTSDMTEGEIFHVIQNGIRFSGMPAFGQPGDTEGAREHWEVVYFIRHLPDLMDSEIEEMRAWNPKTRDEWEKTRAAPAAAAPPAEPMEHHHHHH